MESESDLHYTQKTFHGETFMPLGVAKAVLLIGLFVSVGVLALRLHLPPPVG